MVICHVVICHVVICHVVICHVVICHVVICHVPGRFGDVVYCMGKLLLITH